MNRRGLTDREWIRLRPLLPSRSRTGRPSKDHRTIRRKTLKPGKVALISGGGSATSRCMPASSATAWSTRPAPAPSSPRRRPTRCWPRPRPSTRGAGTLFFVKNYEGDVMNFEMAAEMYGGQNASVLTNDDVAVETSTFSTGRRGVAGTLVVEKVVGAAAEAGADLAALKALGDRVNAATRSMGIALTSCTVPAAGKPTFQIGDDEMEMGVGIHGEPGRRRVKLMPAAGDRRGDGASDRGRCRALRRRAAARQRLRGDAGDGALRLKARFHGWQREDSSDQRLMMAAHLAVSFTASAPPSSQGNNLCGDL